MVLCMSDTKKYTGGCHCGKVQYEVEVDLGAGTTKCNCSICQKTNYWGALVKPGAFKLLSGQDSLSDYQFNTKQGHHLFCKHCGIRSFCRGNVPEIGGEYVSINVNCLDDVDVTAVPVRYLNGRNNTWAEDVPPRP
jgi:hypothetical protein